MQLPPYEAFVRSANTTFSVRLPSDKQVEITLATISDRSISSVQEQFSLMFQGPGEIFMPQGMYTLTHRTLGTFDLFLVPIGKDDNGFSYEAVFNTLRQSS